MTPDIGRQTPDTGRWTEDPGRLRQGASSKKSEAVSTGRVVPGND